MRADKLGTGDVFVTRKAVNLSDNEGQKVACLLKPTGQKKFIAILQKAVAYCLVRI